MKRNKTNLPKLFLKQRHIVKEFIASDKWDKKDGKLDFSISAAVGCFTEVQGNKSWPVEDDYRNNQVMIWSKSLQ